MKMFESNDTRPADPNQEEYHSAECLIDGKQEANRRSSLTANSHSMVKSRIVLFTHEDDKKEQQSIPRRSCDYQSVKNLGGSAHDSFVEWRLDGADDEKIGCTGGMQTSGYVSHEELSALTGCVTRGRMLFSPESSQETSPSILQVVSASTSDFSRKFEKIRHHHHYGSLECDSPKNNSLISSASNPIPDSVSVQFDSAFYDSETVCESSLKQHQLSHTGLNVAAVSRSECNIDIKSTDSNRQCLVDTLSCSIPGELNIGNPQFDHRPKFPGLEFGCTHQSWEFPLSHKSLHSSWPCHHLYHGKGENSTSAVCSCSVKHAPHLTTPHQDAELLPAKQQLYLPTFKGNTGMKSSFSSSLDMASALSVSSCHSASDPSLSLSGRPHISYSTGVDGQVFKDKTEVSFKIMLYML